MNITLTPEMEAFVQEQVAVGAYDSPGEVLNEALLLLREQANSEKASQETLKHEIQIGIEEEHQGKIASLDIQAIKAEGRTILSARSLCK